MDRGTPNFMQRSMAQWFRALIQKHGLLVKGFDSSLRGPGSNPCKAQNTVTFAALSNLELKIKTSQSVPIDVNACLDPSSCAFWVPENSIELDHPLMLQMEQ